MLAGLWNFAAPILGNVGRTLASAFLTKGVSHLSGALADKGISVNPQAVNTLNRDINRGAQRRRRQYQTLIQMRQPVQQINNDRWNQNNNNDDPVIQVQQRDYIIPKNKGIIKTAKISSNKPKRAKFLRTR